MLPPLTMDRTLNNTSSENPNSKHFPPKEFSCTCIEMASFSISVLGRHGKSPACPHLWAGRSHWAPQGKRQSQVLSRVRGRNADYLSLKIFNLGNSSAFDAVTHIYLPLITFFWCRFNFNSGRHTYIACAVKLRFDSSSQNDTRWSTFPSCCCLVVIYTHVRERNWNCKLRESLLTARWLSILWWRKRRRK